ncbi:MAG: hypothetical protein EBR82_79755 [Caulobacteraceae bacterium]|nr:hypothetical protein [Caulobacteraceae bacterium]
MKRPSFQFYPSDWLRDTALRTCSVAARGLWIDMICYMHEGNPYGTLKVGNKVILPPNLASMIGATLHDTESWLNELESAGVFDRGEDGEIMSRRMIRDENLRNARAIGGKLGGNPSLVKGKVKGKVNLTANLMVENKVKQKPTPSSSSSSSTSLLVSTNVDTPLPFDSADFKLFWSNWEQHRKEKKAKLTPTARNQQRLQTGGRGFSSQNRQNQTASTRESRK